MQSFGGNLAVGCFGYIMLIAVQFLVLLIKLCQKPISLKAWNEIIVIVGA